MDINQIKRPIDADLEVFEKTFKEVVKSNVSLLDIITRYIVKSKGKQMRPMFVFLTAKMMGEANESTQRAAALIELLHTATLVHDDVVDDSNRRRGFFSINALWKNKVAVLVGDFLLSKGMLLALENKDFDLLEIVSHATKQMSEGELLQIEKARRLDITEEVYFDVIKKKTASLIASCCAAGAASVNASAEEVQRMHDFGEHVGIAFQIRDDLFDFQFNNKSGKPVGGDIKEKKMTLPLIYMLNNMSYADRKKTILKIKFKSSKTKTVEEIIKQVNASGGMKYAEQRMQYHLDEALLLLDNQENNEYKEALVGLVNYAINRKK
jgi:octaprenyl-diphosphate synthase